jgi:hypothetical protein
MNWTRGTTVPITGGPYFCIMKDHVPMILWYNVNGHWHDHGRYVNIPVLWWIDVYQLIPKELLT